MLVRMLLYYVFSGHFRLYFRSIRDNKYDFFLSSSAKWNWCISVELSYWLTPMWKIQNTVSWHSLKLNQVRRETTPSLCFVFYFNKSDFLVTSGEEDTVLLKARCYQSKSFCHVATGDIIQREVTQIVERASSGGWISPARVSQCSEISDRAS